MSSILVEPIKSKTAENLQAEFSDALAHHGQATDDDFYPFAEESEPDADEPPPSLANAFAEMREQPFKTACEFGAIVLILLFILIGLPLIFR